MNVSKTELSDRVIGALGEYLQTKTLKLLEIDLSRNSITDVGMAMLCESLIKNESLVTINLESNQIKADGCLELANYLRVNKVIKELSLGGNKINNEGVMYLS